MRGSPDTGSCALVPDTPGSDALFDEDSRLLQGLEAGFVAANGESRIISWNLEAERITGLKAADVLGKPWHSIVDILGGNDLAASELCEAALQPGGWDGSGRAKIGGRVLGFRAHIMTFKNPGNESPGVAAIFWFDGGPSSDAERLPYRDLFERSPEPLLLADIDSKIIEANSAACAMLKQTHDRLVGAFLRDMIDDWTETDGREVRSEILEAGSLVRTVGLRVGDKIEGKKQEVIVTEIICTMVSPAQGYLLMRLRNLHQSREREKLLRELAALAREDDADGAVDQIADTAIDLAARIWSSPAALLVLHDGERDSWSSSSGAPASLRGAVAALDPGKSHLARKLREAARPFRYRIDEGNPGAADEEAALAAYDSIWATPIWFADKPIGAMLLLWPEALGQINSSRLEQTGRFAGLAVGNARLRQQMRRDAEDRAKLQDSARIGGVVVDQMPEGIITIDGRAHVTAVNPAAERIYGFAAADAIGRSIAEVVDQLQLDGTPFDLSVLRGPRPDHWQGRVIHRPLIGRFKGRHIVTDLSLTMIRDDQGRGAGYIGMVRSVSSQTPLDTDAALLGSLAVALGRARGQREVAEASLEQLTAATLADAAALLTWRDRDHKTVVASHGLAPEFVRALEELRVPALVEARREPGTILSVEQMASILAGDPGAELLGRVGVKSGFTVDLRVRNEVIGSLLLGSRRENWTRPPDEVVLQVATQIANALENARYLEEERRLVAQLEAMMSLMRLPEGQISEEVVARLLLQRISEALGADGGVVVRLDNGRFKVIAGLELPARMRQMLDGIAGEKVYFWRRLLLRGGTSFHETLEEMSRAEPDVRAMAARGLTSQAVFPIRDGDTLIGAFICHFYARQEPSVLLDERSLEAIGRVISIAYSNVRMSEDLADSAEREGRLAAELRALQELTLLGASPDDVTGLARETIDMVVIASGAAGGGYFLVDEDLTDARLICWVGHPSRRWPADADGVEIASDWAALGELNEGLPAWLSGDPERAGRDYEAVLPLRLEDRLAGFLHLEWTGVPGDEEFDVKFLEPIARVCSISLANFRLRSELVHKSAEQQSLNHRLQTLDELTRIGEQASSFEELAHRTVNLVKDVLGATGVCYLLMEQGHHFDTHAVAGETGAFRLWLKGVPARDTPGGRLLLSGSDSVLENFVAGQVHERVLPLARATGFASFGAIPIRTGEELAGALLCFFEEPVARLNITETALDSVARIAGIALANYRLRDSLSSSEERYRTLFAQTPDALFVSALDGTVLDANEAAVRTYRVNRGEMLGRYIGLLISADEREMARRRQIVWAQGRGTFRDRGRRHDGSEFPVSVEIRVVELDGQRRFLYLIRDMSDEERLTGELLQAQKMEAIGSLVSGVAHELNNPLTGIIGFSALLKSDPRLPDDMRHDAELLVQEADRTKRIVQNLLDFARARRPERRTTPLKALVQSVLDLQSYAIGANQIQVEIDIPDDVPDVDLDRAQFQQVLLNLTINAIQAMRTSSHHTAHHLWISAAMLEPPGLGGRAVGLVDSQRVRITVRDDGPGVPEANRSKLFVPFFTTKEPGEGTGLGLSVSFGIVAAHGGHLYYEPGPDGRGSCFIIEMPVKATMSGEDHSAFSSAAGAAASRPVEVEDPKRATAAAPDTAADTQTNGLPKKNGMPSPAQPTQPAAAAGSAQVPVAAVLPAPETRRPQVLILDDESSIRDLLRRHLTAAGMEPYPFQDGAQALDGVQQMLYDAMLIDHQMAGMSGREFYDLAVQTRPELARRAVFMSGDVFNKELQSFAVERGIRLVEKPFDYGEVIAAIREMVARAGE